MWALSSRISLPLAWRLDPVIEGLGGGTNNGGSARHLICHSTDTESLSKKIEAEYSLPDSLGGGDDGLSGSILGHCSGFSATEGEMTKTRWKTDSWIFSFVVLLQVFAAYLDWGSPVTILDVVLHSESE